MNHNSIYLLMLIFFVNVSHLMGQKESVQAPGLAKEIKKMRDEDQKMRIKWSGMIQKEKTETQKFKDLTQALIAKDRLNTVRMRSIVEQYGWPTYDLVGRGPSNNAWLIVQHADRNPLFQAKCLPLLKKAVEEDQANPSNYAYLYDRVQVAKGEKQLYATQSTSNNALFEGKFYPIEDESNVQSRREAMNIQRPVEEYASSMGFSYSIPSEEEAMTRAEQQHKAYEENLNAALAAMNSKNYEAAAQAYLKVTRAFGSVTTEDFIEAARALSLSKHKESKSGTTMLQKALTRGWKGFDEIKEHPDFAYLKEVNTRNWDDFIKTATDMSIDRP